MLQGEAARIAVTQVSGETSFSRQAVDTMDQRNQTAVRGAVRLSGPRDTEIHFL
jgi:hypothetical protein